MTEEVALPASADPASETGQEALLWRMLALACLRNGGDLLADAELLLQRSRHPRAHSLAVLASMSPGWGRRHSVSCRGRIGVAAARAPRGKVDSGPHWVVAHQVLDRPLAYLLNLEDERPMAPGALTAGTGSSRSPDMGSRRLAGSSSSCSWKSAARWPTLHAWQYTFTSNFTGSTVPVGLTPALPAIRAASGFALWDGPLTIADLAARPTRCRDLAFLSACESATGGVRHLDEAITVVFPTTLGRAGAVAGGSGRPRVCPTDLPDGARQHAPDWRGRSAEIRRSGRQDGVGLLPF